MHVLTLGLFLAGSLQTADKDAVNWFKTASVPLKTVEAGNGFADMEPLRRILKDAEIVGMGECTHGSREVFQMKHRMLEFLVEKMGYRVFAIEASLPDCVDMDRYVTTGKGNPSLALQKQGFWTWTTEEVLELIKWMRAYNVKHGNVLRVVGIDMQNQAMASVFIEHELRKYGQEDPVFFENVSWDPITPAQEKKLHDYLEAGKKKAPPSEALLLDRVAVVLKQASDSAVTNKIREKQMEVAPFFMETLKGSEVLLKESTDISGDGRAGLELIVRGSKEIAPTPEGGAATLKKYAQGVREYGKTRKGKEESYERVAKLLDFFAFAEENKAGTIGNHRDKCMADNLEWVAKTYLPGQKIMLWAHNYHVSNHRNDGKLDSTGSHLTERFKEKYFPIGFAFSEGAFQARGAGTAPLQEWKVESAKAGTLESFMKESGKPLFFVDLGTAPDGVKTWLNQPRPTRSIGALYDPKMAEMYFQPAIPAQLYRGMIFIEKTTRARPLQ